MAEEKASPEENASRQENASPSNGKRRKSLLAVIVVFAAIGIGYAAHWALAGRFSVSTDDAYVGGNIVQVTPQVAGTVVTLGADDTQFVKAGQALVELDQADARVALQKAEAQLAKTVRNVRTLFASSGQQQANVEARRTDAARAADDLARRERLAASGAVSKEDLQHARDALQGAQSALAAAEEQLTGSRALVDGTTLESHPDVLNASAAVRDAYLAYARTAIPAPVTGFVARRTVQLGQRVSPGTPVMAVVPLEQVWVDANFKEAQLADLRVGQPATVTADVYGDDVVYHGRVAGFGAGTGAAFSLLPAQNATGNWIKIVQRVPVRIALDAHELSAHPLQVGLSMQVKVDTHERDGVRLPAVPATDLRTDVYAKAGQLADERVSRIIAENERGAAHVARVSAASARGAERLALAAKHR